MKPKIVIVVLFALVAGVILWRAKLGGGADTAKPNDMAADSASVKPAAQTTPPVVPQPAAEISFLYSTAILAFVLNLIAGSMSG